MPISTSISNRDSKLINRLRGASILRVVLGHLGLGWLLLPYTSYIGVFLSVLFFCSGYVIFDIYHRTATIKQFLLERLLGIAVPFYVLYFASTLAASIYSNSIEHLNFGHLFRAIIVSPLHEEMPFPLGQIWYLRVLIFCILICPIIFFTSKASTYFLLAPVLTGLVLSIIQTIDPIHFHFYWFGHNIYQEIVYGSYFFLGAFISTTRWREKNNFVTGLLILTVAIAAHSFSYTNGSANLGDHAYAPNVFYFSLGVFGILFVLIFAPIFEWIYCRSKIIDWILAFSGKHSYGIYLSHSFFIVFSEVVFGWKGVYSQPILAAAKVLFVLVSSMLCAYPITIISKKIILWIKTR